MADVRDAAGVALPGLSVEVLGAGLAFAFSAGATGLAFASASSPPSALLLLGWPFLAIVGAVVLDQRPGCREGRVLALLSLGSVVVLGWTQARHGAPVSGRDLAHGARDLSGVLGAVVVIGVPWAFRKPSSPRAAAVLSSLAVVAGCVGSPAGWAAEAVAVVGAWTLLGQAARPEHRVERRRTGALLATTAICSAVVSAVWLLGTGTAGYYVTAGAQIAYAVLVGAIFFASGFRPLHEHLLDLGLLLGTVAATMATLALVSVSSRLTDQRLTGTSTAFILLLAAGMSVPAALWIRRSTLARRYGTGLLPPDDVARITADLHAETEPRDLLDKAARMTAAASGSRDAGIVLGEEDPAVPPGWLLHPLVVGGDRVGALLIEPGHPEGPEQRQEKVVAQLLPTVALVARAVGLAVEADHARRDVAREREAERRRVLGDLHDGLGPALAGMSMRVQAALRTGAATDDPQLLAELAQGLATSRTDLRRIVAGMTPSTLDEGDLEDALQRLVAGFRTATAVPEVRLTVALEGPVCPPVQVAVYRTVAEGITNALRHAAARTIDVTLTSGGGRLVAEVTDDGRGGPVVHGVGLSSLAHRAEGLGGLLQVRTGDGSGTTLRLELPVSQKDAP